MPATVRRPRRSVHPAALPLQAVPSMRALAMGTDIEGWVEICEHGSWVSVVDISVLVPRSYDLFGCLFGVRNLAQFRPLFAGRGVPADSPHHERTDGAEDIHDATWVAYEELVRIDPEEEALAPDQRIHEYDVLEDGSEVLASKASWSAATADIADQVRAQGEVRRDSRVYRVRTLKRGEALEGLELVQAIMDVLARRYGAENVRLVVWFGS
jgi:hypothetical protein